MTPYLGRGLDRGAYCSAHCSTSSHTMRSKTKTPGNLVRVRVLFRPSANACAVVAFLPLFPFPLSSYQPRSPIPATHGSCISTVYRVRNVVRHPGSESLSLTGPISAGRWGIVWLVRGMSQRKVLPQHDLMIYENPGSHGRIGYCLAIPPNLLSPAQPRSRRADCMLQLGLRLRSDRAVKLNSAPQPRQPCKMIGFVLDRTTR